MPQIQQSGADSRFLPCVKPLSDQVAEAVRSRATPLSQLLRLMSALDAEEGGHEALRAQLRARIGAPLSAGAGF